MRHLFFDLDRTLWDFEKNSEKALHTLFHDLGLDKNIPDFEEFHSVYQRNNSELWRAYGEGKIDKAHLRTARFEVTLSAFNLSDPFIVEKLSDGYIELSPRQTELFPGAIKTLETLKIMGFPMHIITNGFKEVQYIKLENSGLAPFFDIVICSEELGKNKPSPEIFLYALNKAGAKAENSIMIGDDAEVDIVGALNAGMKAILFDPYGTAHKVAGAPTVNDLSEIPEMIPFV